MSMKELMKMGEQSNFKAVLRKNRRVFLAVLLMPVIGMLVAIPLIVLRVPQNFGLPVGLIIVMLFQYLVVFFFIMRRLDRLIASP